MLWKTLVYCPHMPTHLFNYTHTRLTLLFYHPHTPATITVGCYTAPTWCTQSPSAVTLRQHDTRNHSRLLHCANMIHAITVGCYIVPTWCMQSQSAVTLRQHDTRNHSRLLHCANMIHAITVGCYTAPTWCTQSQSAVTLRQKSTHQNQSPIKVVSCVRFHHHSPSNQQPIRAQIHDMAASRLTMIPQQPSSQLSINSPSHAKQPDHRHTHTHTQTILQITDTRGRCTFAYTVAGTVGCPKTHHHTLATRSQTHVADAQSPTQLLAQSAVWKLTIIH